MSSELADVPALPSLFDYLAYWARETPDAEALVEGDLRVSYAELSRRVEAIAGAMKAAGIGAGDRVATLDGPTVAFVETFLAANAVGAIWLGLNPKYRSRELAQVIEDAAPGLLFFADAGSSRNYRGELEAIVAGLGLDCQLVPLEQGEAPGSLDSWVDAHRPKAADAGPWQVDGNRAGLLVYTSGSTGTPKGALLRNGAITRFAIRQNALWPLKPHRVLNYFPINHIGCVIDMFAPCLVAGGATVLMEQFDPLEALLLIERERLTLWGSVPSVFTLQLALPEIARVDFSSVQLIVWEGAAMPVDTVRALRAICPRLATNYGMTETTSAITALAPTADLQLLTGTVGRPYPGVAVRLCDERGVVVERGTPGEVQTYSDQLTMGYWRNPTATRAAFTEDGWFRTGDIAVERDDGYIAIVGRVKEMFKSGGYNVYPREIEVAIEELDGVDCAAVVSVDDPLWQEVGVAFVAAAAQRLDGQDLERHCKARLANYKVPKHFVVLESLPLLPIGKVDKVSLKSRAGALFGSEA
ncbi:class I adenylate-forming enzyme family protein [Parahaliea mediterranea]|uniref:Acyl--CoA ligase n=1 Tax=Parahaliea mediterranea TaxID=651086 RepID=A0A939IMB7_9GAMM|nr:class I adenylate-forming enzyme family protein [Parahaliea mediterranea]MBN7796847.1 acyl--CoA ligase [Parahaliea mediterranea]